VTGAAKVFSAFGTAALLKSPDPILGIQFRYLMAIVGAVEIGASTICIISRSAKIPVGLIALLSTNFLFYRIGLALVGYQKPCSCLGNLTDALHISPGIAEAVIKCCLIYMLVGSYGLLALTIRGNRADILLDIRHSSSPN
jgi:hypothetical protein